MTLHPINPDDIPNPEKIREEARQSMEQQLREYHRMVEEEFTLSRSPSEEEVDELRKNGRVELAKLIPRAISTIATLMEHGEKESVRANLAKFVIEQGLAIDGVLTPDDPMVDLIDRLTRTKKSPDPTSNIDAA